jgi:apolipoprotein N-acyltransferase
MIDNERVEDAAQTQNSVGKGRLRFLNSLGPATAFLLFANGRHPIAIAAWLAPAFLLRFTRSRIRGGMFLAWVVLAGTWAFQFRGMAPLPPVGYTLLSAGFGLVLLLPFGMDRLLASRLKGFPTTFVLPCSWAAIEYLVATFTPYGSWGAAAYSQHEHLGLLQLVSVTGIYGIGFLIAWFAAVANWVWEQDFAWPEVREGVIAFVAVLGAVLAFGNARLTLLPPQAPTVRVASLSKADLELIATPEIAQRVFAGEATKEEIEDIRSQGERINDDLLTRSDREARAGARIVFWGETNGFVFKEDESRLIERAGALAREHGIYLGLGLGTWNGESAKPLENKLVLIDPQGETVWETFKAIPIPGGEAAISALDDGRIKSADTPFGRLGAVICFDMDFPGLLQQAGKARVDLMLVPSNDWREIDPWHSHMARFRAIEQGFNLVRHVSGGFSVAADYQGRVLNSMDHYTTTERVLLSHVPTRGVPTIYSRLGDSFAWLCILGLLALLFLALRPLRASRARRRRAYSESTSA